MSEQGVNMPAYRYKQETTITFVSITACKRVRMCSRFSLHISLAYTGKLFIFIMVFKKVLSKFS